LPSPQLPDTPVVTPQRTPRGSPVFGSPLTSHHEPPPLPSTPDLTPQESLASPPPRRQRSALTQTPRDESDEEESSHGETAYRKAMGEECGNLTDKTELLRQYIYFLYQGR
jgi:hypothetical protein